jgi:hypothetical protein
LEHDGITYSLLATFRECKEKARLHIKGWSRKTAGFPIVFGSVVHAAFERIYGMVQMGNLVGAPDEATVAMTLDQIDKVWKAENPFASAETVNDYELTMALAQVLLPAYFRFWKADDFSIFQWRRLEHEFKLPIAVELPPIKTWSGWTPRVVKTFIRGKMDGLYERSDRPGVRLFETKTKGRIDPGNLEDILPHQLQPGLYLKAARLIYGERPVAALLNVVRRPQLHQRKNESLAEFATRVGEDIKGRPDFYFMRMEMEVTEQDFNRFDAEFNDLLVDFIWWYLGEGPHYKDDNNCENKYGTCPMLPICGRQFYEGHFIRPKMFSELEEI